MFKDIYEIRDFLRDKTTLWGDYIAKPFIDLTRTWDGGTWATDANYIYVDLKKTNEWTPKEVYGVFLHEVMHIVYGHNSRFKTNDKNDHFLYNIASDIVINEKLISVKRSLPKGLMFKKEFDIPEDVNTSSAIFKILKKKQEEELAKYKELFDKLKKAFEEEQQAQQSAEQYGSSQEGQENNESQDGDKPKEGKEGADDKEDGDSESSPSDTPSDQKGGKPGDKLGEESSDKLGKESDKESASKTGGDAGKGTDSSGAGDTTKKDSKLDKAVKKANEVIKDNKAKIYPDSNPDENKKISIPASQPKIDYLKFIMDLLGRETAAIRRDSYRAYNRRSSAYDTEYVRKGYEYNTPVPKVFFYVDASGSMGNLPVKIFRDMYSGIEKLKKIRPNFFMFDTAIADVKDITSLPTLGGGTSINNVIAHANAGKADLIIMITDCEDTFNPADFIKKTIIVTDNKKIQVRAPHKVFNVDFGEL